MSNIRSFLYTFFVVVITFVVLAPPLAAQTASTGALSGTVTDATGATIPNVTVTAMNTGTGGSRTVATGTDGTYNLTLLPPGTYRVKI